MNKIVAITAAAAVPVASPSIAQEISAPAPAEQGVSFPNLAAQLTELRDIRSKLESADDAGPSSGDEWSAQIRKWDDLHRSIDVLAPTIVGQRPRSLCDIGWQAEAITMWDRSLEQIDVVQDDVRDRLQKTLLANIRGLVRLAPVRSNAPLADDPIFTAIEAHRKACRTHTQRVNSEFSLHYDDPAKPAAGLATGEACREMFDRALELLEIRPTTCAGASALLDYVSKAEEPILTPDEDWRFPDADENGKPFHLAMMKHVANALESTPAGDLTAAGGEPGADPDAALIELGAEYERLLAIEQPLRAESDRLWVVACRAHMEKMGIDPEDGNARCTALNERYDEWVETGKITEKETGYNKASGKMRRASNKTVRIGRKILKIEPATTAGLLVRLSVIATHDEICKTEPLEALQAEIRNFGKGVGVAARRDGRRSVATTAA
jgi:hypothetical protein